MRVLIVDDQPLVRNGLSALLSLEEGVTVVATAVDGAEAVRWCAQEAVEVVLMDVRMPGMDGLEATRRLRDVGGPPVVLLTTFEEEEDMVAGVQAGAAGYLFKSAEVDEIMRTLERVCRGERVFHARVTQALAEALSAPQVRPQQVLTVRELEVLRALATGWSNKRIAAQLQISEGTVKIHVSNILGKLEASSRTDAVRMAYQSRLL
ncbi:response regulator transcription factor [Deinococcus sp. Leaf326]|jgi:DNA-binding NarL/FixJ family response regulator|uniref:response regulator n=1 Tax=Deinococcus sp. Leaf326 TaxID=1736338 RepID=UPI0006F225CD|nr:response regulator transcription factor [Deinococcus sp. Leaf326]KQR25677.1 hypothetical protein ASF71_18500 [Deinococcus sp. Leaf326]